MDHDAAARTDDSYAQKLRRHARRAGRAVMERALQLHYAARSPDVPAWARAVIYGALAYLILPADVVPDLIPGAGYSDDLATLLAALATVASYVTPQVKAQARRTLEQWFGPDPAAAPADQGRP